MKTQTTIEGISTELDNLQSITNRLFEIELVPLKTNNDMYNEPDRFGTYKKGVKGNCFGVVSPNYNPMQPTEIFEAVVESFSEAGLPLDKISFHEMKGGSKINFEVPLAKIEFTNAAKVNDITDVKLAIQTGYDGWTKTSAFLITERLVCSNGMKVEESELALDFINVKGNAGKMSNFTSDLAEMMDFLTDYEDLVKQLDAYTVSKYQVDQMVKRVFDKDRKDYADWTKRSQNTFDSIHESIQLEFSRTGETAFGLLNGITHFVNHKSNTKNLRDYLLVDSGYEYNRAAQKYALQMIRKPSK